MPTGQVELKPIMDALLKDLETFYRQELNLAKDQLVTLADMTLKRTTDFIQEYGTSTNFVELTNHLASQLEHAAVQAGIALENQKRAAIRQTVMSIAISLRTVLGVLLV